MEIDLSNLNKHSSKEEIVAELVKLFSPYAQELINSGADFSYMNMYADNFKDILLAQTNMDEFEIFTILNEACDLSWRSIQ